MSSKEFPKVLIIGGPFNKINGGGITLSNLFQDWPKENLALASTSNIRINADFSLCDNYFQLGYNGKLHPFPLNIILPKIECGPVKNFTPGTTTDQHQLSGGKYKKIYQSIYKLLILSGLYNFLYNMKITEDFINWILQFNPDIIYSQLGSLESIRFINNIQFCTKKPVAIHIMDDWPAVVNQPSILYYYWKRKIDSEFRDLILKSQVLMSISQGMSDEYKKRYKRIFHPFHNPISLNKWLPYSKPTCEVKGRFKILYTGRIGVANSKSVLLIAKVINKLNMKGSNFIFDIYTPDYKSKKAKRINSLTGININKTIVNRRMPELLAGYDLLIVPLDFDKHSIQFAKLSMPTKASEYMISGTPVLVFADSQTFLAKHANDGKWAYVVTENNENALADSISLLSSDIDLRGRIAKKAISFAIKNEDSDLIKEYFRKCLSLNN